MFPEPNMPPSCPQSNGHPTGLVDDVRFALVEAGEEKTVHSILALEAW